MKLFRVTEFKTDSTELYEDYLYQGVVFDGGKVAVCSIKPPCLVVMWECLEDFKKISVTPNREFIYEISNRGFESQCNMIRHLRHEVQRFIDLNKELKDRVKQLANEKLTLENEIKELIK
jgi:hypothetical protein